MNADRFTVKTQEAVQAAVSLAAQHRNPQALPLHLLAALLDQEGSAAAGVLRRVGVDPQAVRADVARRDRRAADARRGRRGLAGLE